MNQPPATEVNPLESPSASQSPEETLASPLSRARASLQRLVAHCASRLRTCQTQRGDGQLLTALQAERDCLNATLDKLDRRLICIAAFGLVSRGKSAVLNALLGQKVLPTGPLNGVTQWPRSVHWVANESGKVQVELIDTPGLDEANDQARADMARQVARQVDLILFVVSGDITRTEYDALCKLRRWRKPLLLVFNKIDLYPERSRQEIYQKLQALAGQQSSETPSSEPAEDSPISFLLPNDIVMVAAEPVPVRVRNEWPDGRVTEEWETPAPKIEALRQRLLQLLNQQGKALLAVNGLRQARDAEVQVARQMLEANQPQAEALIWRFARYKALAVAFNPIAVLDLLGGAIADLALIRSLAQLYDLPMTSYEAGKLLKTILLSSVGLFGSELASSLILGLGKSGAAAAAALEGSAGLATYASTAALQASLAGYGTYRIGRAAQVYLEQGCTWGVHGPDTAIQEILTQLDAETLLARLYQEVESGNGESGSVDRPIL